MWQRIKAGMNPHKAYPGEMSPKLWAICIGCCIVAAIVVYFATT